jgi:RNA polymerase sigma-70 factor (sigma-E family)
MQLQRVLSTVIWVSVGGDHGGHGEREHDATVGHRPIVHGPRRGPAELRRAPRQRSAGRPAAEAEAESLAGAGVPAGAEPVPRQADGQDAAFREFVTSRERALLRSAYLLTGNVADAEDLVQSALAKTYQAWNRIEDRKALDGYVRRAMVNTHISWWRRRKLEEYPTDQIPDLPGADTSAESELRDTLQRAINRLPQRMRAAVVLRFFEDMTEAEVAAVLGVSQGTVKSTVSRAVAKLRTDANLLAD